MVIKEFRELKRDRRTLGSGRRVRVSTSDEASIDAALRRAGIAADLRVVPAILDEAMVAISTGA